MDKLLGDIQYIKGIGPKRSLVFKRLNINYIFDLLWYMPRSYLNRDNVQKIAAVKIGEQVSVKGIVMSVNKQRTRNGMLIFKAMIKDETGFIQAVWFNQVYVENYVKSGLEIYASGRMKSGYGGLELNVSDYEILDKQEGSRKVLPIYPLTEGLNQKALRNIMLKVLEDFLPHYPEIFNPSIREKYNLCDIQIAFRNMHFPTSREAFQVARRRLALEELYLFQLSIDKPTITTVASGYIIHKEKTDLVAILMDSLPFKLTDAQNRVLDEIFTDMEKPLAMNRLIQGDVGSGKTAVAALAMAKCVASGFQSALMAPTEILAEQHYKVITKFFEASEVVIARLTSSTPAAERRMIMAAIAAGEIDILIGTHALIQTDVVFNHLGLVVIDEQHRFGVKQRAALANKGNNPDVLVMTATPIPRTLALTVYGDLQLSVIDEMPPGRIPIKTMYVKNSHRRRVYDFIKKQLKEGKQVYVVCPLVEESEKQDLQAAETLYLELKNNVIPEFKLGLLHGRLKSAEKEYVMTNFKQGNIDLLVSTTVIEVGVDVPNASIIVIEQAERFGLSQLHQLRGRVGRGNMESYCILIADPKTEEGLKRLKAMENTTDGFVLANEDLKLRGPGDFWGVRQHGLNQLKVASLASDHELVELSRIILLANDITGNLTDYIKLKFNKEPEIAPN